MSYVVEPGADPQEVRRRRRLAEALLQQGTDTSPILSPWQGAARLAQGLMGGIELGREDKRENDLLAANKAQDAEFSAALAKMYGGGGGSGAVSSALGAGKPMGPIKLGGFEPSVGRVLQFEGGLNPADTNGTPSNMGINQAANPDVDVKSLTKDQAVNIYKTRYWDPIQADKMDPRLAHIAFDTSVIAGPGKAKELLEKSGGDPEAFLKLREDFQNRLLQANPEKFGKYAKAWANRNATLRADIGVNPGGMFAVGGGGQATMAGGSDNLQPQPTQVASADMATAMQLLQRARTPQQMAIAKQMVEEAQKANDPLRALQIEQARRSLNKPLVEPTAAEREYELAKKQGFTGTFFDFKKTMAEAGAAKVNNSVNTNPGPAKNVYDTVEKQAETARAAAASLPSFAEAKRLIETGNITLGAGADTRVAMQKFGALFGMDATSASNAEIFKSIVAPQVFALIKNLGAGSGISNNDLKFAEKAAGGDINLEPATLRRLMLLGEKAARLTIDRHQQTLDEVYPEADPQNRQVRSLFRVDPSRYAIPEVSEAPAAAPPPPAGAKVQRWGRDANGNPVRIGEQ